MTSASTWLVGYMHVTDHELHVCKMCNMILRCFIINTTLACITQMIIWLCEIAYTYALGVQRVKVTKENIELGEVALQSACHTTPNAAKQTQTSVTFHIARCACYFNRDSILEIPLLNPGIPLVSA